MSFNINNFVILICCKTPGHTEDDHIIPLEWIGANLIEEEQFEVMETYQYFVVQHL
jgi:hypothetical protein